MIYFLVGVALAIGSSAWGDSIIVEPLVETDAVPAEGDAADDPCIWVHPTDPALSTIIGTNKQGGIAVYGLDGRSIQYLPTGEPNNVDIRYDFTLNGEHVDIVVASEEKENKLIVFRVNPSSRFLEPAGAIAVGIKVYGLGLYHDQSQDTFYAFVNSRDGEVEQWRLYASPDHGVAGERVRRFNVGSQVEGCVADDMLGCVYIGEEEVGLWKYNAAPDASPSDRTIIDTMAPQGRLSRDIEGLAIFYGPYGSGYLIASSQGNDEFLVYEREGDNAYVGSFRIGRGVGIDEVTHTDGIDVSSVSFSETFASGVFVAQDDENPGSTQNFKLVPWEAIAKSFSPPLRTKGGRNPRINRFELMSRQ